MNQNNAPSSGDKRKYGGFSFSGTYSSSGNPSKSRSEGYRLVSDHRGDRPAVDNSSNYKKRRVDERSSYRGSSGSAFLSRRPPFLSSSSPGWSHSGDNASSNAYWDADYVTYRCQSHERVLPGDFSLAKEEESFQLWLALAKAESSNSLAPSDEKREALETLTRKFTSLQKTLQEQGWIYDAMNRTFREFCFQIDAPSSTYWFTYVPLRDYYSLRNEGEMMLYRPVEGPYQPVKTCYFDKDRNSKYTLQIRHPLTLTHEETVAALSSNLLRRYHGVPVKTVGVLVLSLSVLELDLSTIVGCSCEGARITVCNSVVEENVGDCTLGDRVNAWINSVLDHGVDIVVITTTAPNQGVNYFSTLRLDLFMPVYPVFLSDTTLVTTPVLMVQTNACHSSCQSINAVFTSFHQRACTVFGAILAPEDCQISLSCDQEETWYDSGLHTQSRRDVILDGRFWFLKYAENREHRNRVAYSNSWCHHGWCSIDTRAALSAAIEECKPRVIVELGSWYGKSTRYILNRMEPGSTIYCVDYYKNNAIYQHCHSSLSPEDKMFFNFPRFESFVSGMESELYSLPDDQDRKVCVVKMDIHEAVPYLHEKGVVIDLLFIDAEKKTDPLMRLVNEARSLYPQITIVGDDHVFKSVQAACRNLRRDGARIITLPESYLALPEGSGHDASNRVEDRMKSFVRKIGSDETGTTGIDRYFERPSVESIQQLRNYIFPDSSRSIRFGHQFFYPDRDHFPCLAFSVVKRGMAIIKKYRRLEEEKAPDGVADKLIALILEIIDAAPIVPMTEGRLTMFDYINHNITFE